MRDGWLNKHDGYCPSFWACLLCFLCILLLPSVSTKIPYQCRLAKAFYDNPVTGFCVVHAAAAFITLLRPDDGWLSREVLAFLLSRNGTYQTPKLLALHEQPPLLGL